MMLRNKWFMAGESEVMFVWVRNEPLIPRALITPSQHRLAG
jgi:hypothetical protein